MSDTVLDRLVNLLDEAQRFNGDVFAPPIALLWPDEARQWEPAIAELRTRRRVLRHGAFDPEQHRGPAYWMRCVLADTVELVGPDEGLPIVYLPGVSREALRALDTLAPELAPLGGLQYRCQWFSHPNGKDWTVRALLSNTERGLGLNIAGDPSTTDALTACVAELLDQPLARLEAKHIDAAFLNGILNPDPVRTLLNWLDDPTAARDAMGDGAWSAFVQQCTQDFGFNPASNGEIDAARRLGDADGAWAQVWQRFRQNPGDFPGIPDRLRVAQPGELLPSNPGAWPGLASDAEDLLRGEMNGLAGSAPQAARDALLKLDDDHKARRSYVWADLGWTPLVLALEQLAEVARLTTSAVPTSSVGAIVDWYASTGWRADRAVLMALNEVERKVDLDAVGAAINAVYRPWLDTAAKALQEAVGPLANAGTYHATPGSDPKDGEVVVFIDGLRLDVAHLLAERLDGAGLETRLDTGLAALPTVTQTAKPVLVPVDQSLLTGGSDLDACRATDGPKAGVQVLRSLMSEAGVQVLLGSDDTGDPRGVAWTETGELDSRGHQHGLLFVQDIDDQVQRIATRISDLLAAGWATVSVVTDHGWLLLPGGLPKNESLPFAVTETKKGRCARIKDGADVSVLTVPWHWDRDVRIAVAPGISCFEANQVYEHGGISPQECIVPRLTVTHGAAPAGGATITNLKWRGLTLVVEFADLPDGATIDLRSAPADAATSIAEQGKSTSGTGKQLLLVDEDLEGDVVHLVVVGAGGSLLLHRETTVGQNR